MTPGLRDTGRHSGNPAREYKSFTDGPDVTWADVQAVGMTPHELFRMGIDMGRSWDREDAAFEASEQSVPEVRRGDYLVVLFILAVGFTIGALVVGFVR